MSHTSVTFHAVTKIDVKYSEAPHSGGWLTFTFRDEHGGYHDVTAHVARPIEIEGAEYVNFVAAHEQEAPDSLVPLLQASIEAAKAKKEALQP